MMKDGSMYGMNEEAVPGVRADKDKVREMAYIKMVMRELGMDEEDAEAFVKEQGLSEVIKMFQKKSPEDMEKDNASIKGSLGKYKSILRQIEEAE